MSKTKKARGMVWDDSTRTIMGSLISEVAAHTVTQVLKQTGIQDPILHAKQHEAYDASIPFIHSLKAKEDSKTEFFDAMGRAMKSQAANAIVFLGWVVVAAIPFGLAGGFAVVKKYFGF